MQKHGGEKSIFQYVFFKRRLEADSKIILSDIQRGQFNISEAQAFHVTTSKPHDTPAAERPCLVEEEIKMRGQVLTQELCLTEGPRILGDYCVACVDASPWTALQREVGLSCFRETLFPQAFSSVLCSQIQP